MSRRGDRSPEGATGGAPGPAHQPPARAGQTPGLRLPTRPRRCSPSSARTGPPPANASGR